MESKNPHSQALRAGDARLTDGRSLELDSPLTVGAAGELLDCSPATVVRWIDSGRLRGWSTPGGHRRTNCDAVVGLLKREGGRVPNALIHLEDRVNITVSGARMCFDGPEIIQSTDPALGRAHALNDASELSVPAIAVALGVSPTSVERWINDGLIPTSNFEGKQRRASVEAVRLFLEEHSMPVPLLFRAAS